MSEAMLNERTRPGEATDGLLLLSRSIFSLAIVAFGVETFLCARFVSHSLGGRYAVLPVLPWLPAIPWLAYLFAVIWTLCGLGVLFGRTRGPASLALGSLLFLCTLVLEAPKYALSIGNISLRTIVFEPLAIACLAWLLPGPQSLPRWLMHMSHYLLALSLIVFGADHFLALQFIAPLIPPWIPSHQFLVGLFGAAMIAAGISMCVDSLRRFGAVGMGLMFAIWVITLHGPRVLGFYGLHRAPKDPNEWSSLFIAVALWGGFWALARTPSHR